MRKCIEATKASSLFLLILSVSGQSEAYQALVSLAPVKRARSASNEAKVGSFYHAHVKTKPVDRMTNAALRPLLPRDRR